MKKAMKVLLVVLLVVATAMASVYGTLAYLKATDSEVNVMVIGNVDVDLHEDNGAGLEDEAYQNWLKDQTMEPGVNVEKNVWIENTGKNPAYLRLYVYVDADAAELITAEFETVSKWQKDTVTEVTCSDGKAYSVMVLTYGEALAPGAVTDTALSSVLLNPEVECVVNTDGSTTYTNGTSSYTSVDGSIPVQVFVEACQVSGFADAYDALSTCFWAAGEDITTHNPLPGGIAVYWDGSVDTAWYDATKSVFDLSTAEELAGLAQLVNSGVNFYGKTVNLTEDINLANKPWTPIGTGLQINFQGVFNGNGHTISNLNVEKDHGAGLFGYIKASDIDDVHVINANITTKHYAGVIVANATAAYITDCSVTNATISCEDAAAEDGDKAGGIVGYISNEGYGAKVTGCEVENVNITANRDAGVIVGAAQRDVSVTGNSFAGSEVKWSGYGTNANMGGEVGRKV